MRKDEIASKNISLVFDFLRYVVDNPDILDKIPDESKLEFLDKDVPTIETEKLNKIFLKVEHTFSLCSP